MVDGGDNIVEVSWESVSSILQVVSAKGWEWDPKPLYSNKRTKILDPSNLCNYVFELCEDLSDQPVPLPAEPDFYNVDGWHLLKVLVVSWICSPEKIL